MHTKDYVKPIRTEDEEAIRQFAIEYWRMVNGNEKYDRNQK